MNEQEVKSWVTSGPQPVLLNKAEKLGERLCGEKLTTSQIRQVFTKLKAIEAKGYVEQKTEFMMLKPYIAYAAKRKDDIGARTFKEKITWGIDAVLTGDKETEKARFYNFCKFFEAVLAYHKASGGK